MRFLPGCVVEVFKLSQGVYSAQLRTAQEYVLTVRMRPQLNTRLPALLYLSIFEKAFSLSSVFPCIAAETSSASLISPCLLRFASIISMRL